MNKEEKNALKELEIFTSTHEDMRAISMTDLKILYNLILRLLRENQSYIDYLGTPPCYEDSKYVSKDKIKEYKDWYENTAKHLSGNGINLEAYENAVAISKFCNKLLSLEE